MLWIFIILIIICEAIAQSSAQKLSESKGLKVEWWVLGVMMYGLVLYFLSRADKLKPMAKVNALWSSISVISIALVGHYMFKQKLSTGCWIGLGLISIGFIVLCCFQN